MNSAQQPSTILFDGVCNFCNASVRFIIRRDPHAHFNFASLQSPVGQQLLNDHNLPADSLSTMFLIEDGTIFSRSTAALRIARKLRFPWPILYAFIVVPPVIRDTVYNLIAKYRYRLFGKKDACPLPPPNIQSRFLA